MAFFHQILILTDEEGLIVDIHGKEEIVLQHPNIFFEIGKNIRDLNWGNVFTTSLDFEVTSQSIKTNYGDVVYYCSYSLKNLACKAYVFIRFGYQKPEHLDTKMIFESPPMKRILQIIDNMAEVDPTILLLGESGVGKSAIARLIHNKSSRREMPFVTINCGSLPENLIESELFGYEPGTFTGGKNTGKIGLFEAAEGGTIFLDEIAEIPYFMQSKLLDVVQKNKIRRVGGISRKKINIRIITATNKDLASLVSERAFREDLYYRLNVVPIRIPSLRERQEDIPDLIKLLIQKFNRKYESSFSLTSAEISNFCKKQWLGNVRELENTIERLIITNGALEFEQKDLALEAKIYHNTKENPLPFNESGEKELPTLKQAKEEVEKKLILQAYRQYENTYKTAEVLGVDQSTISKKIKKYFEKNSLKERNKN